MEKGIIYWSSRTPVPKQDEDKPSGKVIMSVNFETGERSGSLDEYYRKQKIEGEDQMKPKADITREQFFEAVRTSSTNKEAMKKLGIGGSCFYKYRTLWANEMDKQAEPDPTEGQAEAADVTDIEDAKTTIFNTLGFANEEQLDKALKETGAHIPSQEELESFFGEVSTFNPEPPKDNRISVLEAVDMLEDLRYEMESIAAVFASMEGQAWHQNIRKMLKERAFESNCKIQRIESVLGSITVAI